MATTAVQAPARSQVIAWIILWAAFAGFVVLCIGSLLGLNWFRANATQSFDARLGVVTGGTVTVQQFPSVDWRLPKPDAVLRENDSIQTDRTSRALVTLFEGSTVQLMPDSEIQLSQLRRSAFTPVNSVAVVVKRGKAIIGVAKPPDGSTEFFVNLPQGRAVLREGSYAIVRGETTSQVKVREIGTAFVTANNKTVTLDARKMSELGGGPNGAPTDPAQASIDLVTNGEFIQGLTGWLPNEDANCLDRTPAAAKLDVLAVDGRPAIRFLRERSGRTPCEIAIRQEIGRDVSEFFTLKLSIEADLENQSLDGGGTYGSEYPLKVRVIYRAVDGSEQSIVRAFYMEPPKSPNFVEPYAIPLPASDWKLTTLDDDLMTRAPLPRSILAIEIVAGGHDYESWVRKVSLVGE